LKWQENSLRELYNKIYEIIEKLDYGDIWSGFNRYPFALYDKENVFFKDKTIPYNTCFLGNTAIEYDGAFLAIWCVENPLSENPEALAANIVHEMFHAYQRANNESRFPDDLLMLDYPYTQDNITLQYSENLLLSQAAKSQDLLEKKNLLMQFAAARKYREGLIGDIIKQEYLRETVEGMAEYAGNMALKQISPELYKERVGGYIEKLEVLDERLFDIGRLLYYSGFLLCNTLAEAGIDFYHAIGDAELPLFDIIADNSLAEKPDIEVDKTRISAELMNYMDSKKSGFNAFLSAHKDEVSGDFYICGYDPMNMVKFENMILCSHFIMLMGQESSDPVFIEGPVLLKLRTGTTNNVMSYIR